MVKGPLTVLHEKMLAKLVTSGLDAKDAKLLGYEIRTRIGMGELNVPQFDGFILPYFTLDGSRSDFYRVRYLVDTKVGFAKLTTGKGLRYAQAPESLNEVYMPPSVKWGKVAADIKQPIIITEGELKSALACKLGMPTAGLGGVWNFRASSAERPLLKWFTEVKWKERPVYICYDSDAASNPQVAAAENTLARALTGLGALVRIVRLPASSEGQKQGLDDYLLSQGKPAFEQLLENAPPHKESALLYELNEKVIYVRDPGLIIKMDSLQRMSPMAFTAHAYANLTWKEEIVTATGKRTVERYAAKEWLKWPHRSEAEKVTYAPGQDRMHGREINIWPGWGTEPKPGDVTPWSHLLDFLFAEDLDARLWFEQWLAYPIQHPGTKLHTAAILWGSHHGTGKSLVGSTMRYIYGKNASEIGDVDLGSSHNEWAENKQFVVGEEITGGDGKRNIADRLKSMITQRSVRINAKYIPAYEIPDCMNYYFTSNHSDSFMVEEKDRRFFIHEVRGAPASKDFYDRYGDWLRANGPAALHYHLGTLDLTGFNPAYHAPMTQGKVDMIESSRTELGRWVHKTRDDPEQTLKDPVGKALPYKLWSTEELMLAYDPEEKKRSGLNAMSRELSKAHIPKGAGGASCRTDRGQIRVWLVRDPEQFEGWTATEIGRYYNEERNKGIIKMEKYKK